MSRMVIVAYKAKPGKTEELKQLLHEHVPVLRTQGLVTERPAVLMEAADDVFVEVFEWASAEAIQAAHQNSTVAALWKRFEAACEYIPIADVAEAKQLFSEFSPR